MEHNIARKGRSLVERTPVVVVGAGPVGMVTALELAHHGVPSILVDQHLHTTTHPKLDIVNTRGMELLDRLGLANDIRTAGVAPEHHHNVIWSTGLDGEAITTWELPSVRDMWRRIHDENDGTQPAQPWQRLSQIDLEPVLRAHCAHSALIQLRLGYRFVSLRQDADGVTTHVAPAGEGEGGTIRSSFVVGCDGTDSSVRDALGIPLDPTTDLAELPGLYMVHLRSRDLAVLHRHGRFWHYFAFRYVILAQDEVDTWTIHAHARTTQDFEPPPTDPAAFVRELLGVDLDIDEVLTTSRWRPHFRCAPSFRVGRVALAGDAAHQMFPTGGYGMNTGVGDAVDIGWKLAAIVNGWGGPRLLEGYEVERRPVGARNIAMSRRHVGVHMRAGELLRGGEPLSEIAAFLQAERGENEAAGVELGDRYAGSPLVQAEQGAEPAWESLRYTPTTWPGGRPPSVVLNDGSALFHRLGPEFTLVDFLGDGRAVPLLAAARVQGVPIRHTVIRDDHAHRLWERNLVLVRPDHHVAWRGDTGPEDPHSVLRRVRGAESRECAMSGIGHGI